MTIHFLPVALSDPRHFRSQREIGTCVIEITELNSEIRFDPRGCLEAKNGQKLNRIIVSQNIISKNASG